jgi:hypothetical protein
VATLKTGTTIAGQTAWHVGNDGAGSGMDADTLDGLQGTAFAPSQVAAAQPTVRAAGDIYIDNDSYPRWWDQGWQYPLLINGWVNYSGWGPARYRRLMSGLVIMEGLIQSGSGNITTVAVGYRPQYHTLTATIAGNWSSRLDVYSSGEVVLSLGTNANNGFVSLCCWWYSGG